jgi:hypothetical protein
MTAHARRLDIQFRLLDTVRAAVKPQLVPTPAPPPSGVSAAVQRVRAGLEAAIASQVMNARELLHALAKERRDGVLATSIDVLDALLGGGLPRGKVVEIASRRAAGRFSIVMATLAAATSAGEAAALIDHGDHFDPQLAEAAGVDLRRLLWVRPRTMKQAVMSAEKLAATGFTLVVFDAGLHPVRGRPNDAAWVRLARTAEAHGTAMLVTTPYPLTGTASEAVVVADRVRTMWIGSGKAPRVLGGVSTTLRVEKHRRTKTGKRAVVELRCAAW